MTGNSADWSELAKDRIALANSMGGRLLLGIEDEQDQPPAGQLIPADLPDTIRRKIAERTVNVRVLPVVTAPNRSRHIDLAIPRAIVVAPTTDGRNFLRVADQSKPVTGDDVLRFAAERAALPWETQTTLQVPRADADPPKASKLVSALRASARVKPSVTEKTDDELLDHYQLTQRERIALGLLRSLNFTGETTLQRTEPHRLAALVLEDLHRCPSPPSVTFTSGLAARFPRASQTRAGRVERARRCAL